MPCFASCRSKHQRKRPFLIGWTVLYLEGRKAHEGLIAKYDGERVTFAIAARNLVSIPPVPSADSLIGKADQILAAIFTFAVLGKITDGLLVAASAPFLTWQDAFAPRN